MSKFKILIVDDSELILNTMKLILNNYVYKGMEVDLEFASSGYEAKSMFGKNERFDLLLLDIIMETKNAGFEVVDYIRNNMKDDDVRIFIVSGRTGGLPEEYIHLANGIDGIINKCEMEFSMIENVVKDSVEYYLNRVNESS